MDEHKRRFLHDFVLESRKTVDELLRFVMEREEKLRNCYSEAIGFGSEDFAKMILLDAAFLIEFFYKRLLGPKSHDRLHSQLYMCCFVWHDLLLLENQIPFFILQELFDFSGIVNRPLSADITRFGEPFASEAHSLFCTNQKLSFIEIIYLNFRCHPKGLRLRQINPEELDSMMSSVPHILDFLRTCLIPEATPPPETMANELNDLRSVPSATELHQAGVQFQKSESENYFNIQFDRKTAVLKIPSLFIGCMTESLLRNLVAYEQFYCLDEPILTEYLFLLGQLIDVPRDIDILHENKILENTLGDGNTASAMFNGMAQGLLLFSHSIYFPDVCVGLNTYYRRPWHRWKATLKEKYFNSPWAAISVFTAAMLLILTFVQTVFCIIK